MMIEGLLTPWSLRAAVLVCICLSTVLARSTNDNSEFHVRRLQTEPGSFLCPDHCDAYNCDSVECKHCELYCGGTCAYRQKNHELSVDTSIGAESCSAPTFDDVSSQVLREEFWYKYPSLGRTTKAEAAPLFVDFDNDGTLDMWQGSHSAMLAKGQVGADGLIELVDARNRVDMTNPNSDNHGSNIVDLDGDGIPDLLIGVGGGLGGLLQGTLLNGKEDTSTDNMILWGERRVVDGESVLFFHGGKDAAKAAGIEMRDRRARFNYVFDANGDGLLDIYFTADRPRVDVLAPGILMINQGDRTFKKDHAMQEYSKAMILTDADGDGFANEFVITRDHCYTQSNFGPYPDCIVNFCMTRPVGTTAVYKYNSDTKQMEDIGKKYTAVEPDNSLQPSCCPLGKGDTFAKDHKNCFVQSTASGDFDQDQFADQVFLYTTKIAFYFSTDRSAGTLPFGGQSVGAEIHLPHHCHGKTMRVIDFDNDGKEEIIVGCFEPGMFLLYSRGDDKDDWTLINDCNGGLGDLSNVDLTGTNAEDYEKACEVKRDQYTTDLCDIYNGADDPALLRKNTHVKLEGMTTIDLDSDGFMDLVVAYRNGHHLFLRNRPPPSAQNNRFIALKLDHAHGIGATVILHSDNCDGCSVQFREISSYQHATDKWGYKDDRVYFGLGPNGVPTKVEVRWPNGVIQTEELVNSASNPLVITLKEDIARQ